MVGRPILRALLRRVGYHGSVPEALAAPPAYPTLRKEREGWATRPFLVWKEAGVVVWNEAGVVV